MYTQVATTALRGRVGWKQYPAAFPFVLTDENKQSASGRYFQDFSAFVTLTNVNDTIEDADSDEDSFNLFLSEKQSAVIATVLSDVFSNKQSPERNFDEKIIAHIDYGMFDDAIGLQMSVSLIEMMNATIRSNMTERLGKDLSSQLYRELNGLYTDNGVAVAIGLQKRLVREITRLREYFFPKPKSIIITPKIN